MKCLQFFGVNHDSQVKVYIHFNGFVFFFLYTCWYNISMYLQKKIEWSASVFIWRCQEPPVDFKLSLVSWVI